MRVDINYKCDDCGATEAFASYIKARGAGWAISRDYKYCYCPECAPAHRLGGANGKRSDKVATQKAWLPNGWKQTTIDDLKQG